MQLSSPHKSERHVICKCTEALWRLLLVYTSCNNKGSATPHIALQREPRKIIEKKNKKTNENKAKSVILLHENHNNVKIVQAKKIKNK